MDTGLHNTVVLITGAAGDIGRAIAGVFAGEGVRLALLDSNEAGLHACTQSLMQSGAVVSSACVDLTQDTEVFTGVEAVLRPYDGQVDVLINNAGICPALTLDYLLSADALADWKAVYDVNFYGYLRTIMAILPRMRVQGSGCIINNVSDLARQPEAAMLPYSTAKAAVLHLTHALARELGPNGIRVNAVCPGPVRTAIWTRADGLMEHYSASHHLPPEDATQFELRRRGMPIARLAQPEEVAYAMLYLASRQAGFVTGLELDINGGSHQSY